MITLLCTALFLGTVEFKVIELPATIANGTFKGNKMKIHIDKDLNNETENWVSFENDKGHRFTTTLKCEHK